METKTFKKFKEALEDLLDEVFEQWATSKSADEITVYINPDRGPELWNM